MPSRASRRLAEYMLCEVGAVADIRRPSAGGIPKASDLAIRLTGETGGFCGPESAGSKRGVRDRASYNDLPPRCIKH